MIAFLIGIVRRVFAPMLCALVTRDDIDTGALRFAHESVVLWAHGYERGSGQKPHPKLRRAQYEALHDAYTTGAREALRMVQGDFSPEPWTD